MNEKEYNDLIYVCALIEYIARETRNHRGYIVDSLGEEGLERQLKDAEVNHCLSFEQVCSELVERYNIKEGTYDTISTCKYSVPGYVDIGKLYAIVIKEVSKGKNIAKAIKDVFSSFISDAISRFNSDLYYQNPDYIKESYLAGELLV